MPVSCEFRGSVLALVQRGLFSNEDVERAVDEALADPRFKPGARLLWDTRESHTPLSSEDMQSRIGLFLLLDARGLVSRIGVLYRSDQEALAEFGRAMVRRFKGFEQLQVSFFTNEAEAMEWLDA